MKQPLFSRQDLNQIKKMGLSADRVRDQIEIFKRGIRFTKLCRPATVSDGIRRFSKSEKNAFIDTFEKTRQNHRMIKFLPASGAASRMFRIPLFFLHNPEKIDALASCLKANTLSAQDKFMKTFLMGILTGKFPFSRDLKRILSPGGQPPDSVPDSRKIKMTLEFILLSSGLNFANLPKALIPFHSYGHISRTPVEEHMVECRDYIQEKNGVIRIHLTVAEEMQERFRTFLDSKVPGYDTGRYRYHVNCSIQDPSTNTVAVDQDNAPVRDDRNRIVFRQGGHGALLQNLNRLDEAIIFISNIDNVVPDRLKPRVVRVKKTLAGYLITIQNQIFKFLNQLAVPNPDSKTLQQIFLFCKKKLCFMFPNHFQDWETKKKAAFLTEKLNRPIRVCGMVANRGEPGGGPFWVKDDDGHESLQIVEKAQVNLESVEQYKIFSASTHFNPVDLVCGIRNFRGEKFPLHNFIDSETYFISEKSQDGRPIKALEHPGLWNGGMANWITLFVEVPILTFNPVKTINDLLRPKHQTQDKV